MSAADKSGHHLAEFGGSQGLVLKPQKYESQEQGVGPFFLSV